jgi:hypothetical protein
MTKISQYSTDVNITGNDKWIGSDAQNFLITKNFTPNNLASFFNENNVIDIGTSIRYRYQTLLPGEAREQGTISFETEIGPQVNFSAITTFLIAKNTLKGNTVTQYLDFLVDGKVLLSKASNINIFGYYKITSIEPWIPNTNFFVVEVDFLAGNGFISEDLDYLVSLVDKVQDIPPPVWGSITGDIEDQTDLIDYISSQITTPTLQQVVDEDPTITLGTQRTTLQATGVTVDNTFTLKSTKVLAGAITMTIPNGGLKTLAILPPGDISEDRNITFPNASGTLALTSDITTPTLQEVLAEGNETGGENIVINDADAIQLENASTLKKGTYDFGADGGISRICGVGFEDMWQSGIRHVFDSNGLIRNSTNGFNIVPDASFDNTLRFKVDSLWTLDNGDTYKCTDASTGAAVWDLVNTGTTPTLQEVLDEGDAAVDSAIFFSNTANDFETSVNEFGDGRISLKSVVNDVLTEVIAGQVYLGTVDGSDNVIISKDGINVDTVNYAFPSGASSPLATLADIPTGGGIPHATAAGTDTYTATVTGVTAYNDADAYLIRFTNGNTTGATLNINALGAIPLYRNNDGPLLGGDILAGGEMLCIYNSTTNRFQVIGISPNSLIAYVTNDDSVTLTKGMPVYAFSGTGDRMTVKRANNTGDATSAQTVGLVLSTSIAANQKGIIMMQGLLDGLSILPTATWDDGDPVYLGATPGTITNIKPYAPNHLVYLGVVTTASNGAAGRIYVRVQNGYELQELHNVDALNPDNNDGIFYNSITQLWEHKNVLAVAAERRNANNSINSSINYCGIAPADSLESASVWIITRLTITLAGAVTTASAINVKWTDRETATYT